MRICVGSSYLQHSADVMHAGGIKHFAFTMMRLFVLLLCIVAATAFTPCAVSPSAYTARTSAAAITNFSVPQSSRFVKPTTSLEVRLNGEDEEVKVVEMEVDAFTLTAVGFGLIAFNFLVLANVSTPSDVSACYFLCVKSTQ